MKPKSINHVFSICAGLIFVLLTSGCVGPTVRTHSGDKLQKSEVAVIRGWYAFYILSVESIYIYRIDDTYPEATKVEVLPGWHELVIKRYEYHPFELFPGAAYTSGFVQGAFNFEAGHEYKIKGMYKGIYIEGVKIIDVTTGDIIFSQTFDQAIAEEYNNQGLAYRRIGKYDQAISDFNKAVEINPKYAQSFFNRGVAYMGKDQCDQAISDYTKALEIDPRYEIASFALGVAYMSKGQYDQAISDLTKAIEINPRYGVAYFSRGRAYYYKKEYDKSWEDVKKAQDLSYKIHAEFLDDLRKASGREK